MKRLISFMLAMIMVFMLAACGGGAKPESASTPSPTTSKQADSTEPIKERTINAYGWEVPEETITITYYSGRGKGNQADEDAFAKPMADFLKNEFNVVLNKIVFDMDMNEKLNLMLAAGDYPEAIAHMHDDMANQFIGQGKAQELTPYIEQYGENISKGMGNYINLMKNDNGELYKLPVAWGNTTDLKGRDFSVRYDMWLDSGLPMYTNMEEFYQTVKKLVELNPVNANGEKVYGISSNDQGQWLYNTPLMAYGFINGFKVDKTTNEFTHWINTDEGLDIAVYINRFFREDLIDPDFLNNKWDDWMAKVTNERVIANIGNWWHMYVAGHEAWIPTEGENYKTGKRFVNVSFAQPGVKEHTLLANNFIRTNRAIITDKSKQPENIIKWWNWEATEVGRFITCYGVPGPSNVYDIVDGNIKIKDIVFYGSDINNEYHKPKEENGAMAFWMLAPGYTPVNGSQMDILDDRIMVNGINAWGFEKEQKNLDSSQLKPNNKLEYELYKYYETKTWDAALFNPVFLPENPVTDINQNVKDTLLTEWAKIITSATEEECIDAFMNARNRMNRLGLAELEKFNAQSYVDNLKKFNGEFGN